MDKYVDPTVTVKLSYEYSSIPKGRDIEVEFPVQQFLEIQKQIHYLQDVLTGHADSGNGYSSEKNGWPYDWDGGSYDQ